MSRSIRILPLVGVALAAAIAIPCAALAGKKAVSGQQTLQIKARLTPSRASATRVKFGFHFDYRSTHPPQQPPYNTKTVTLVFPPGLALDPTAAPSCKRSQIDKAKGNVSSACPRKTIVGHGTLVANAAPTVPVPITGTVTIYNAVNNVGEGQPRGTRNLILWAKTSIGVNAGYPFRVLKGRGGRVALRTKLPKPKTPGVSPGSFTIQTVTLSISHFGRRPFITNPPSCHRSWPFSLTVVNWFNQPSITAHDRVKCSS
jgi:hypothetical protein